MGSLVGEINALTLSGSSANIDNHVFRAHYIFTSVMLLAASSVLVATQFFGVPIDCIADGAYSRADAAKHTIDNFCWVAATYTVAEYYGDDTKIGISKLDNGVGQFNPRLHTQRFQLYYRWIFFLLFIQGMLFYFPHYLWRSWESGKMEGLSTMLNIPVEPTLDSDRRKTRIQLLLNFLESFSINSHEWYTYRFYFCEGLNLAILLFNFWITNWILDYEFMDIGLDVLCNGYSSTVLTKLFPVHAKCLWRTTGPSGSIQEMDALCVLPLNSFNRFMFAFLWFWYMILGVVTLGWLIFRITTIFKFIRSRLLRWKACPVKYSHHDHPKHEDCIDRICSVLPHEDWFVVLQLVDNTDSVAIKSILGGLCERLTQRRPEIIDEVLNQDSKKLSIRSRFFK